MSYVEFVKGLTLTQMCIHLAGSSERSVELHKGAAAAHPPSSWLLWPSLGR